MYMNMTDQLIDMGIQSMNLSDWVEKLGNGNYKLSIPKDLKNPSKDNVHTLEVDSQKLVGMYMILNQPKKYTVDSDSITSKVLSEGDAEFDINRWTELMLGSVMNNKI